MSGLVAEPAPAKVNLSLHVTGRRVDGYHRLDSLVAFADIGDRIEVEPAPGGPKLRLIGPFAQDLAGLDPEANLVVRAARRFGEAFGHAPDFRITIDKRLPVAAGIGGGSADAAATLRALSRLRGVAAERLAGIGAGLGADVPACLLARPCRVTGIGERLRPVEDLPDLSAVLANPGTGLATPAVFARYRERRAPFDRPAGSPPAGADAAALIAWLARRTNGLEAAARALDPAIDTVLQALRATAGARLARLSGSGPTCFALYPDAGHAEAAAAALAARYPGWWVVATRLGRGPQGEGSA